MKSKSILTGLTLAGLLAVTAPAIACDEDDNGVKNSTPFEIVLKAHDKDHKKEEGGCGEGSCGEGSCG